MVEWGRKNRETNEEHDKYCAEERFQLARVKFDRDGKGVKLQVCGIVASRKAVHILKTIFQYFYYLVFRIHQFLRCVVFNTKFL